MKRYWTAAAFAAFIAITIGTYYVQASYHRLPQFRLTTLEGDGAEAAGVILNGNYMQDPYGEMVQISEEGSRYNVERSLWQRINEDTKYAGSSTVRRLIREHSNFMRGNVYSGDYYQDEEWVVRAQFQEENVTGSATLTSAIKIAILDKKSQRTQSFTADLSEKTPLNSIMIVDVQRAGSLLKLAVLKYDNRTATPPPPEFHVYNLDLSAKKITGNQLVPYEQLGTGGTKLRLNIIQQSDPTKANRYLVLQATSTSENAPSQMAVYDYQTGKIDVTRLPDQNGTGRSENQLFQDGDRLLFLQKNDSGLILQTYRLANRQPEHEIRVNKQVLQTDSSQQMLFGNNRLFVLFSSMGKPSVAVIDTADGRLVYRGEVTAYATDSGDPRKLQLYNLDVKE